MIDIFPHTKILENLGIYLYWPLKPRGSPSPTCQEAKLHWKVEAGLKPRGSYSVYTIDVNLEILHFKQFYKYFVFEKSEEGYVKKTQKNYMDVRVVLRLVWWHTKNIINSFCTF